MLIADTADSPTPPPRRLPEPDARLVPFLAHANRSAAKAESLGIALTPTLARENLALLTRAKGGIPGPEVARVLDDVIAGEPAVPIRLYDPAPGDDLPICVYLHGGGHMVGSIAVYDPICRRLAATARCRVVAVEYRLAPEHPYPQGLEDCARALAALPDWLSAQGVTLPQGGLAVAGDSGGGALTASLSARAAGDAALRIGRQILIYPSLDYTLSQPSVTENGEGYLLDTKRIRWYFDHYFQHAEDRRAASPLFMPPAGLPPTLLLTAGFCPLRDEGYAYARQLRAAGVTCEHWNLPGMIHAFLNLQTVVPDACQAVYDAMGRFLND